MQSWSIIILFYNEENTIEDVFSQAVSFLKPLKDSQKEIILVNDGSTDKSLEKAKKKAEGLSYVKFINHEVNKGIGATLRKGYEIAKMENVCAVPGDGQFDLDELRAFRNIKNQTIVSFYRIKYNQYSFFRFFLTYANRLINKIFFAVSIKDVNWIKIYKNSDLKSLSLISKSSYIESEILIKLKKKCRIIQSPNRCLLRKHGKSKSVNFPTLKAVIRDILLIFIKN